MPGSTGLNDSSETFPRQLLTLLPCYRNQGMACWNCQVIFEIALEPFLISVLVRLGL